ncbi:hypothetical protein C6370_20510 [Bacillus atrophaeus]|nr:hypothetical protein C6370_20510 [Bacillus atrophaeus]
MIIYSEPKKHDLCNNCGEKAVTKLTFEDFNENGTTVKLCVVCLDELCTKTRIERQRRRKNLS